MIDHLKHELHLKLILIEKHLKRDLATREYQLSGLLNNWRCFKFVFNDKNLLDFCRSINWISYSLFASRSLRFSIAIMCREFLMNRWVSKLILLLFGDKNFRKDIWYLVGFHLLCFYIPIMILEFLIYRWKRKWNLQLCGDINFYSK